MSVIIKIIENIEKGRNPPPPTIKYVQTMIKQNEEQNLFKQYALL